MGGEVQVGVGGEDPEMVEVVGGTGIVAVGILELAEVVEGRYLFEGNLDSQETCQQKALASKLDRRRTL